MIILISMIVILYVYLKNKSFIIDSVHLVFIVINAYLLYNLLITKYTLAGISFNKLILSFISISI